MEFVGEKIHGLVEKHLQAIIDVRRYVHRNPELSFQEANTAQFIRSVLAGYGIRTLPLGRHHSFIAVVEGKSAGRTIGIRAELDAMPILEETTVEYASIKQGMMHACGHDLHIATVIGAGIVLHELRDFWNGRVLLVFESGEEQLPGGAMEILDSDEFNSMCPEVMFGLHVLPELEAGKVGFCSGRYMASGDEVYLTVKGRGGHAALPHTLVDPVVIAANIILNLQTIVSRSASALVPTVLSFGKVEANGATNIIPNEVRIEGTFRTMDEGWRTKAHSLIEENAKGIAMSMGGDCLVEIRKGYPSVYNDPEITENSKRIASELLGAENVIALEPRMTTDDFAYFSQKIPSVFFRVGVGFSNLDKMQLHSGRLVINEESIRTGMLLLLNIAFSQLDLNK